MCHFLDNETNIKMFTNSWTDGHNQYTINICLHIHVKYSIFFINNLVIFTAVSSLVELVKLSLLT